MISTPGRTFQGQVASLTDTEPESGDSESESEEEEFFVPLGSPQPGTAESDRVTRGGLQGGREGLSFSDRDTDVTTLDMRPETRVLGSAPQILGPAPEVLGPAPQVLGPAPGVLGPEPQDLHMYTQYRLKYASLKGRIIYTA